MKLLARANMPWLMLFSRLGLFALIQGILAFSLYIFGKSEPWESAASWWPFVVTITNLIGLFLLIQIFRMEGKSYWRIFHIDRKNLRRDIWTIFGILVVASPISYLPNIYLANFLFGDIQTALDLFFRPLPFWAVLVGMIVFPVTQGLVEIPTYFSYIMPQFEKKGYPVWLSLGLPALFLGVQHIAVPLLFNIDFITYRALMFLPFALLVGIIMRWRPRLLPYLAIIHVLMDVSSAALLFTVAY